MKKFIIISEGKRERIFAHMGSAYKTIVVAKNQKRALRLLYDGTYTYLGPHAYRSRVVSAEKCEENTERVVSCLSDIQCGESLTTERI